MITTLCITLWGSHLGADLLGGVSVLGRFGQAHLDVCFREGLMISLTGLVFGRQLAGTMEVTGSCHTYHLVDWTGLILIGGDSNFPKPQMSEHSLGYWCHIFRWPIDHG